MADVQDKKISGFVQYRTLLRKDIYREFRTKEMLVSMIIYAFLVIVVYGVALGFASAGAEISAISSGLIWAMVIFTSLLGLNRSFSYEAEGGCLEGLLLAPMDRGIIFLAKATSNLLFLLIVEAVSVPLFFLFFSGSVKTSIDVGYIVVPLILGSIGIAGVGTLLSTITVNTKGRDVMLALLFIPLVFPLLYACVSAAGLFIVGAEGMSDALVPCVLAAAYDFVMVLASWLLYQFTVSA